jgi:hypothetical protein
MASPFNADFRGRENNQPSYDCQVLAVACSTQRQRPPFLEVPSSVDYFLARISRKAKT